MQHPTTPPPLSKWPFFLADAFLLGLACAIFFSDSTQLSASMWFAGAFCLVAAGAFGVLPFVLEYKAAIKLNEIQGLASTVAQIQKLEQIATQISTATGRWQTVQESADTTANIAKQIAAGMAAEVKAFNEFLERSNESEKATLRLEVDKLHRAEGEWLQVAVRMLDHVYALNQAAVRSGQQPLIEQLGNFQNACRDAARRVGLTPFIAAPKETFDERRHQLVDEKAKPANGAAVEETLASGYTFQGKLVRPALVRLQNGNGSHTDDSDAEGKETAQSQLPLGSAQ